MSLILLQVNTKTIKSALIKESSIDLSTICAIGCDGAAVNTGKSGDVIHLIENELNKNCQWIICLLHTNELPVHHLFMKVDDITTGLNSFAGVNCKYLSTDENYLMHITNSEITTTVVSSLENSSPVQINHSRWLTTANRILCLYASTNNSSSGLMILVEYIERVYSSTWFPIKKNPSIENGFKHVFVLFKYHRKFPILSKRNATSRI